MAILALGFSFPQAFAASLDSVMSVVKDIQAKVNSSVFGLSAIKSAVDTKASQTSVNNAANEALTQIIDYHIDSDDNRYNVTTDSKLLMTVCEHNFSDTDSGSMEISKKKPSDAFKLIMVSSSILPLEARCFTVGTGEATVLTILSGNLDGTITIQAPKNAVITITQDDVFL
jgi:hypothetical protein